MNVGPFLLQIVLIFMNAVFACAEIAVIQMGDTKLKKLAADGDRRASKLLALTDQPAKFLATIQVAITLAGYLSSAFAADSFSGVLVDKLVGMGVMLPRKVLSALVIILITIVLGYVNLIFGELVPKRVAMKKTESISLALADLLTFVSKLFSPIVWTLTASTNGVLKLLGINPDEDDEDVSEEDIMMMLDAGTEKGTIDTSENEFIQNVFEFNDLSVEDVCTHRTDVVTLYMEDSDDEWRKTIYANRFTYYPICGEDDDDVIGILDTKDYFRLEDQSRENVMQHAVDKPYFVSQNMKASNLFQTMKKDRTYYAIALDEYGGMTGIVTLHDLVEALVGDLQEEDELPEPNAIEPVSENEWIILGSADLEEVNEALDLHLQLDDCDTFGGYILGILGKVPDDGASFHLETDDLDIDVAYVRNHRIGKTVVRRREKAASDKDTADSKD